MLGHAQHDNQSYVPKELLEQWRDKDPLENYEKFLKQKKLVKGNELAEINDKIQAFLDVEVEAAEASPFPDPATSLSGVYDKLAN